MLERRWESGESQIFLLWGRRRVGKTELLLEFGRGRKTLFFEATSGTRSDHLRDFSERPGDRDDDQRLVARARRLRAAVHGPLR